MSKISPDEIRKIAVLARLHLSSEDVTQATHDLGNVLEYVAVLNELDVQNVEPMTRVIDEANRFRDDEVMSSIDREAVLFNAPHHDQECFLVPKVLE